jgi:hypothetical protein
MRRPDPLEPIVTDQPTDDSTVLLLDPSSASRRMIPALWSKRT